MSELTTIARPYAKAAFDYAVEQKIIAGWQEMLVFAAQVAQNPDIVRCYTNQFQLYTRRVGM